MLSHSWRGTHNTSAVLTCFRKNESSQSEVRWCWCLLDTRLMWRLVGRLTTEDSEVTEQSGKLKAESAAS